MEAVKRKAKQDMMRVLSSGKCECTETQCCGAWELVQLAPYEFRYSVAHERYVFAQHTIDRERARQTRTITKTRERGAPEIDYPSFNPPATSDDSPSFSGGGGESSGGGASGDY